MDTLLADLRLSVRALVARPSFALAACGLGLGGVALLARYLPARAAARVAPTEALRAD